MKKNRVQREISRAKHALAGSRPVRYIDLPSATRKIPKHPQMPSRFRDRLTGSPLTATSLTIHFLTYDPTRPPGTRFPIPMAVHTLRPEIAEHCEEALERMGSPDWSPEFARYIGKVRPKSITEPTRLWVRWWEIAGAWQYLAERFPHECVDAVSDMVFYPDADLDDIAACYAKSRAWLLRNYDAMMHCVRRDLWQRSA